MICRFVSRDRFELEYKRMRRYGTFSAYVHRGWGFSSTCRPLKEELVEGYVRKGKRALVEAAPAGVYQGYKFNARSFYGFDPDREDGRVH